MIALALILWLHPSAKSSLIKSTEKGIKDAALYLGEYSANPPAFTTTRADSAYVLRGEEDIVIVEEALQFYKHGQCGSELVIRALKQLQRDLEDIPPAQTEDTRGKLLRQ